MSADDGVAEQHQPFPRAITAAVDDPDAEILANVSWSELELEKCHRPFKLPAGGSSYNNMSHFITTQVMLETEKMRSEIGRKIPMVGRMPKEATEHREAEKHLQITLPRGSIRGRVLSIDFAYVDKEPSRGKFTNYIFVFQTRRVGSGAMENICLAYSKQMSKKGAIFGLGRDSDGRRADLEGATIYARPLVNCSQWKTQIRAIVALKQSEAALRNSFVTSQLLRGCIDACDTKKVEELDAWIQSKSSDEGGDSVELEEFNQQQQRSLALDDLTPRGLVLIQGPPGTGKSHIICHGILPQAVSRNERILVVCNSNVAVDALMLKCVDDNVLSVKDKMRRCGFKDHVSSRVVDLGLFSEGNTSSSRDQYGNTSGANSNTLDVMVQSQIRSARIIFTTIHFASKEKGKSDSGQYWTFDTLVLDEAAQIEDAKLMMILARAPSLNKIILVGDPKQIQPYVPDSLRDQGFGRSSMERVMDASESSADDRAPFVMLEQQFRMAPLLRSVVSHLYYNDRLQDDDCVRGNGPLDNVDLKALLVVNVTGTAMNYSRLHGSYENESEAQVVKVIYDFLFGSDFEDVLPLGGETLQSKDVCILTPYNRHKDRLRMKVCNIDEDTLDAYEGQTYSRSNQTPVKSGSDSRSNAYSRTPIASPKKSQALLGTQDEVESSVADKVENIDTVDKFQGTERNVVLISTCGVTEKDLKRLGRTADPHFINVACSRAKHVLVVVGNFTHALAGNADWKYVKGLAMTHGSYLEHEVTSTQDLEGETTYDIHEKVLKGKLQELMGRPKKRGRGLYDEDEPEDE